MGDGELPANEYDDIEVPDALQFDRSWNKLMTDTDMIEDVFGDSIRRKDYETILHRAIFAARNVNVNKYNQRIVSE